MIKYQIIKKFKCNNPNLSHITAVGENVYSSGQEQYSMSNINYAFRILNDINRSYIADRCDCICEIVEVEE